MLVAALAMVLAGCDSDGGTDGGEPTISTAAKAPVSEFTVACPEFTDPQTDPDDDKLPALSLECLGSEGEPVTMSGSPPRPTVINLWASWCSPCREEMPILEEFATAAADKVDLLGVASSDNRTSSTAFAVEYSMSFPSVLDPKAKVMADQGLQGLPGTLFMDEDGVIVYKHVGVYKSLDELKQDVADHLGVTV